MAYIEKIKVTDEEKEKFKEACKKEGRSMVKQCAKLIRDFFMKYEYLSEIVTQIEKCKFTDENGSPIEKNKAFIALKEHSISDKKCIKCKS